MTRDEAILIFGTALPAVAEIVKELKNSGVPEADVPHVIRDSLEARLKAEGNWEAALKRKFPKG